MSEFRISGPGFYRTSDGKKVEITGVSAEGYWLGIGGFAVGAWLTELKKGTVWVNVYANGCVQLIHESKEQADERASPNRLACVSVNWTEGEGLS